MQKLHFDVTGMSCAACSARVEKAVKALDGCCNVTVNLLKNDMTLELDDAKLSQDDVVKAVTAAGYGASLRDNDSNPSGKVKTQKKNSQAEVLQQELTATRKRLYWSLFFCALLMVITMLPMVGITFSFFEGAQKAPAFAFSQLLLTLPVLVLTFASLGGMTRYVRSAMIDALSMDYIRTARAKGLREKVVIYSHAWRNALLPVITVIISWFLSIFSGSVIVETTFTLNGMGQLYYQALRNSDYELALACQMFYCVVSLVGALIMDLSYGLVDPRVRVDK